MIFKKDSHTFNKSFFNTNDSERKFGSSMFGIDRPN